MQKISYSTAFIICSMLQTSSVLPMAPLPKQNLQESLTIAIRNTDSQQISHLLLSGAKVKVKQKKRNGKKPKKN